MKNIEMRINSKKITHTYFEKKRSKFLPDAILYIKKYYKKNIYSFYMPSVLQKKMAADKS